MKIIITQEDAWIIDYTFHNPHFSVHGVQQFRGILLKVGRSIVANRDEEIDFSVEELWILKTYVLPTLKVGHTTGQDFLSKVYRGLLEYYDVPIPVEPGDVKLPTEVPENTKLVKYDNKDRTESGPGDCTGCRSG